jgi:hypothetical protein
MDFNRHRNINLSRTVNSNITCGIACDIACAIACGISGSGPNLHTRSELDVIWMCCEGLPGRHSLWHSLRHSLPPDFSHTTSETSWYDTIRCGCFMYIAVGNQQSAITLIDSRITIDRTYIEVLQVVLTFWNRSFIDIVNQTFMRQMI